MKKLFMVALILTAAVAWADPPSGIVDLQITDCPDPRWYVWTETVVATWERPPCDFNDYELEAWYFVDDEWIRWQTAPAGRERMVLDPPPEHGGEIFKLRLLGTRLRTGWATGTIVIAQCSFNPPEDGSVWVWDAELSRFELRPLTEPDTARMRRARRR